MAILNTATNMMQTKGVAFRGVKRGKFRSDTCMEYLPNEIDATFLELHHSIDLLSPFT